MKCQVQLTRHRLIKKTQQDIINPINLFKNILIDLGYIGNTFTRHKNRKNGNTSSVRLDHALVNYLWMNLYSSIIVANLPL